MASIYDKFPDNEPISIIGQHLDLTIAFMLQGRFMYWKVLEPPELLGYDAWLVAYIPDLPYQEGNNLSPIREEGTWFTEIATDYSDESYTDRYIYMEDVGNGRRESELLEDISAGDLTANAGNEDDVHRNARRGRNHESAQQREDTRQR